MITNLRKRRGFDLGFGGGGGAVTSEVGDLGRTVPLGSALGGIDVGGAVCMFPLGGCGGIRGTPCGGTTASEVGVTGDDAVADVGGIGPGAGGVGPFAV